MKNGQKLENGTLVNIQDEKSLFNGKSGVVEGYLGADVMVCILVDGEERHVLVRNAKLEILNQQ